MVVRQRKVHISMGLGQLGTQVVQCVIYSIQVGTYYVGCIVCNIQNISWHVGCIVCNTQYLGWHVLLGCIECNIQYIGQHVGCILCNIYLLYGFARTTQVVQSSPSCPVRLPSLPPTTDILRLPSLAFFCHELQDVRMSSKAKKGMKLQMSHRGALLQFSNVEQGNDDLPNAILRNRQERHVCRICVDQKL